MLVLTMSFNFFKPQFFDIVFIRYKFLMLHTQVPCIFTTALWETQKHGQMEKHKISVRIYPSICQSCCPKDYYVNQTQKHIVYHQ
jgi:hypothetical protein